MVYFEKVSFEQYLADCLSCAKETAQRDDFEFTEGEIEILKDEWDNIKLPKRATYASAGYDFYAPFTFVIPDGNDYITIPTGIRFVTDRDDITLICAPRSGLGFKNQVSLANTIGVIDADYWQSKNHGHIMAKLTSKKSVIIERGKAYMQGIIVPFVKTDGDDTDSVRDGGFGSTDT